MSRWRSCTNSERHHHHLITATNRSGSGSRLISSLVLLQAVANLGPVDYRGECTIIFISLSLSYRFKHHSCINFWELITVFRRRRTVELKEDSTSVSTERWKRVKIKTNISELNFKKKVKSLLLSSLSIIYFHQKFLFCPPHNAPGAIIEAGHLISLMDLRSCPTPLSTHSLSTLLLPQPPAMRWMDGRHRRLLV